MGIEIERKFLLHHKRWEQVDKPEGEPFLQGYLMSDANKTIRVRVTSSTAYLTIKGKVEGFSVPEYEYEIPKQEGEELLQQFAISKIEKLRYKIAFAEKTWEIDVFSGKNEGLIVAEIELENEAETFEIPDFIAQEVTGDARYYNANLAIMPFKNW